MNHNTEELRALAQQTRDACDFDRSLLLVIPSETSFHVFLSELAIAYTKRIGPVAVACGPQLPGSDAAPWPLSVAKYRIPECRSSLGLYAAQKSLKAIIRKTNPTLVHAHFLQGVAVSALARFALRNTSAAWLGTLHGLHVHALLDIRGRLRHWGELLATSTLNKTYPVNSVDETYLTRWLGTEKVGAKPDFGFGCDTRRFDPGRFSCETKALLRRHLGIPQSACVVAFLGRRTKFKGFHLAVRAFSKLKSTLKNTRLLLVGRHDTIHHHGLSRSALSQLHTDNSVIDVGWQSDPSPYMAITDVLLVPSSREGCSGTIMEAQCLGTPVVTLNTRGCVELTDNGSTAVVCNESTPAALASEVLRLAQQPSVRLALTQKCLQIRHRYSREHYIDYQLKEYERVLKPLTADDESRRQLASINQ